MTNEAPPYYDEQPTPSAAMAPHDLQAEEALLGAVLISPETYAEVAQIIKAEDFFSLRHRWIWEAIARLNEGDPTGDQTKKKAVDLLTVAEELARAGHLDEIGGQAYLVQLTTAVPSSLHAAHYARLVEEASVRRRMLAAAERIAQLAHQRDLEVEAVLDEAEKALFNVSERRITRGVKPFREVLLNYYEYLDHLRTHQGEAVGIPTGFFDLDKLLNGFQPSDFVIVAARPGMGKTAFLLSIAKTVAQKHKKRVAVFSLEMANEQLVQRLLSQETGIDSQRLRTGEIAADEWEKISAAVNALGNAQIFLDDTPAITPIQLRTKCRRLHMEFGLDLIMVDYLQLMSSGMRSENRVQEVSQISRNLKALARELNVPVVAAAQLSRAVEQRGDKRPMLSDLRESGSLEQDADVVMFIYRDEVYNEETERAGVAEIIVAKHRNGPTGKVDLVFQKELARFRNAATHNIDPTALISGRGMGTPPPPPPDEPPL